MIKKITDKAALYEALGTRPTIYTEKIRSLAEAYDTGYDFCSFYTQTGGAVISEYYRSAVVANAGIRPDDKLEELMEFLICGTFHKVVLPYRAFEAAGLDANVTKLILMKYDSNTASSGDIDPAVTESAFSLSDIYDIASDGFDIDFSKWYTDTNHMVRHGISKLYAIEKKACAVRMFSFSGITYLSYVCTKQEERGKGLATRLLRSICAEEARAGNSTYVFCEAYLCDLYERSGFMKYEEAAEITI